jgi:hypothetical protein
MKALNEIRLQNTANFSPVMKFKGKFFNTFIAQVKAKELMTDVDDVEFEDWCVTNLHAHFWYCADVSKLPMLKIVIKNVIKNLKILTYLTNCLIQFTTYKNISLLDLSHRK